MQLGGDDHDKMLSEINVTPLVDVMLVLLIIFMVTAPLIQQGIPVNLPASKANQSLPRDEKDVVLHISRQKRMTIDKYPVEMSQLGAKLKGLMKGRKEKRIYIKADRAVDYGTVIAAMGYAKAAGIDRIGMVTDPNATVDRDNP